MSKQREHAAAGSPEVAGVQGPSCGLVPLGAGGPEPTKQGRGTRGELRDGGGTSPAVRGVPDEEPGRHSGRGKTLERFKGNNFIFYIEQNGSEELALDSKLKMKTRN